MAIKLGEFRTPGIRILMVSTLAQVAKLKEWLACAQFSYA